MQGNTKARRKKGLAVVRNAIRVIPQLILQWRLALENPKICIERLRWKRLILASNW